jgi:hypothetical protein
MKLARWIILAVLLIAPMTLAFTYTREFLAVDSALDSGASYDYQAGRADFTQNHSLIPFSTRHGTLLKASSLSLLTAIIYSCVLVIRNERRHSVIK